jgi:hypothetical protein
MPETGAAILRNRYLSTLRALGAPTARTMDTAGRGYLSPIDIP